MHRRAPDWAHEANIGYDSFSSGAPTLNDAYTIAVVFTGLAGVSAAASSHLLLRRLPRDGETFKALFARRRRNVGRRRFWLRARFYLPWVASPKLVGAEACLRSHLLAARACGMLFVAGALSVLAAMGYGTLVLAMQ